MQLTTDSYLLYAVDFIFFTQEDGDHFFLQLAHLPGFDYTKLTSSLFTEVRSDLGLASEEFGQVGFPQHPPLQTQGLLDL